jgi:hypothetical protein
MQTYILYPGSRTIDFLSHYLREENAITFEKLWIMKDISVGLQSVPWGLFHL